MGLGEKDSSLMLMGLLPKAPVGSELTFHLTFDKWSVKANNSNIQFVDKPKHNTTETAQLYELIMIYYKKLSGLFGKE